VKSPALSTSSVPSPSRAAASAAASAAAASADGAATAATEASADAAAAAAAEAAAVAAAATLSEEELAHVRMLRQASDARLQAKSEEEAKLQEMKEQRLGEILEDMDKQMRGWCRALAERRCQGEPWRNVSENKLKVLSEPSLEAPSFEGEFVAPGAVFGVEEARGADASGRRWLRRVAGGWVADRSRKDAAKVVANRADWKLELAGDDVFRVGPNEDRREAYMRMVHRKNEAELQIPEGLKVELMPYQVEGVEWLVSLFNNDLAGLLADEMGLGKTIQTIGLIAFLREAKKRYGPHLIICPKSVVSNWKKEIDRCFPEYAENVVVFQGSPAEREELAKRIRKVITKKNRKKLIVITNYEQVHPDRNKVLHEPRWELIVVDEGHRMKNSKTVFHQTMKEHFSSRMKLLLTGTPLQNNLDELFSLLNYLLPEIFTCATSFKSWFAAPFLSKLESMDMNEYFMEFTEEEERQLVSNLHAMLAPFLLQRTKADVLGLEKLPPRREEVIRVPLSAWQLRTYEELKTRTLRRLDADGEDASNQLLQNTTMQLRKISLHPYLFGRGTGSRTAEDIVRSSGKMEALDRLLRKLQKFGHKVLIFSQFTSMLDVLEELLQLRQWGFERIDGQVSAEERQARIQRFSDPGGKAFVFLLSSRAGAVGLNLQAADTVVLFDLDWNPQNDKQAIARAHRFGQTREVLVVRLLSLCPVEEHMERRAAEKLDLERKIIGAGGFSKKGHTKTAEERAAQLRELFGSVRSAGEEGSQRATGLSEANELLARSADERAAFNAEDQALGLRAAGSGEEDFPAASADGGAEAAAAALRASVLVRSGRLMAPDEVPEGFEALESDEEDPDSE